MRELKEITMEQLEKKLATVQRKYNIPLRYKLTYEMIDKYADKCGWWHRISCRQPIDEEFYKRYTDKVRLQTLVLKQPIQDWFFKYQNRTFYFWACLSSNKYLTEELMDKYKDQLSWLHICRKQKLSDELIMKYADKVDWYSLSRYQPLSDDFILSNQDKIKWNALFQNRHLAKDFYERNKHLLKSLKSADLAKVIHYQKISPETMMEIKKGKMVWRALSAYGDMTRDFVIQNYEHIHKRSLIFWNRRIDNSIKEEVKLIEQLCK